MMFVRVAIGRCDSANVAQIDVPSGKILERAEP
jgi:hypothetical protein